MRLNATVITMPFCKKSDNKQPSLNFKKFNLLPVLLIIILGVYLSGCSIVGSSKSAALQVTATPEASIFLNGKHLGKTPFFSDQLKSGTYDLKITAGSSSYVVKVDLNPNVLTVVNRQLNDNFLAQSGDVLWLENGSKDVFLASVPDAVDIMIDGKYKGKTPILITDLDPGDHKVTSTKSGYIENDFDIKTSNNYKLIANITLASQLAKNPQANRQTITDTPKVEVLKTPQGFLRVRNDPDLNSQEVGRVNTGDQVDVIQETTDWVKISSEGKVGWVSKQYTKKI